MHAWVVCLLWEDGRDWVFNVWLVLWLGTRMQWRLSQSSQLPGWVLKAYFSIPTHSANPERVRGSRPNYQVTSKLSRNFSRATMTRNRLFKIVTKTSWEIVATLERFYYASIFFPKKFEEKRKWPKRKINKTIPSEAQMLDLKGLQFHLFRRAQKLKIV